VLNQSFASCVSSLTKAAFFYGITIIVWATILRPGLQVGLSFLKVVGNEKNEGSRRRQMIAMVLDWGDRGLFTVLTCSFCLKILFSFPLVTSKLNRRLLCN
jgi:hypothetical protein